MTDCRSQEGVTVGLIDAVIAVARVLAPRLKDGGLAEPVREALRDLRQDEDVRAVVEGEGEA